MILILITWFRLYLLDFSNISIFFLPLHTVFLEASQNVQPHTLEEEKQALPHAGKNSKRICENFCYLVVIYLALVFVLFPTSRIFVLS